MKIFYSKTTRGFYCEHNTSIPDDAVEIAIDYWQDLRDKESTGLYEIVANAQGYPIVVQRTITSSELIEQQYTAIDSHILQVIKTANIIGEPANYDNVGELGMYIHSTNDNYRVEAQTLIAFVEQCHAIQADIISGVLMFDSVDDAIAALPTV